MVPLNYRLSAGDLEYIIRHSDAKMLIVDEEFCPPIEQIVENLSLEEIIIVSVPGDEYVFKGHRL